MCDEGDAVRWSMDFRYEATAMVTASGKQYGFVARSGDVGTLTGQDEWLARWDGLTVRSYL
ncbi:hypothetical protein MK163_15265 [bacterium]|nr:hypothetical protein [bacterium]